MAQQPSAAISQVLPAVTREVPLPPTLTPAALLVAVPSVAPTPSTLPQIATPQPSEIATPQPTAVPTDSPPATSVLATGRYRDGSYTGSVADAYFGDVQVQAVIRNCQLADVTWMTYPIPGMGLGLALTTAIAHQYNGVLRITSSGIPGQGTAAALTIGDQSAVSLRR